jgi:hypothetical protein
MWLLIVDAHSKWPEVFKLGNDTTSSKVINCVRETFARFGIVETIHTDNGPQFVSKEFEEFCTRNSVRHSTSSAYHPRSNGEAERFVRSFKNAMKSSSKADLNLSLCNFLLTYRVTPHATTGVSPSEMMMKHKTRTLLDLLRPNVDAKVRMKQELQQEQFNGKIPVREFHQGQQVWVQSFSKNEPKWSLGSIVKSMGPVSYQVNVDGRLIKRHVDHILSAEAAQYTPNKESLKSPSPKTPSTPKAKTPATPKAEPRKPESKSNSPEFADAEGSPTAAVPIVPIPFVIPEDDEQVEPVPQFQRPQRINRNPPERFVTYQSFK